MRACVLKTFQIVQHRSVIVTQIGLAIAKCQTHAAEAITCVSAADKLLKLE